jgi:hypothetical protein
VGGSGQLSTDCLPHRALPLSRESPRTLKQQRADSLFLHPRYTPQQPEAKRFEDQVGRPHDRFGVEVWAVAQDVGQHHCEVVGERQPETVFGKRWTIAVLASALVKSEPIEVGVTRLVCPAWP